ncbi:MAG TPA: glycoside hydrolase family 38 C-terminal domain-containing protein, partial [Acidimicrobiia bacterium]
MHDDRRLVEARIHREIGQWVVPAIHTATVAFTVEAWDAPGEPVPYDEAMRATYAPFTIGARWGARPWGTTWFKFRGTVPTEWTVGGDHRLEAVVDLGFFPNGVGFQAEGAVWEHGSVVRGIHPCRRAVPLATHMPGDAVELTVEAAANPAFAGTNPTPMGSRSTAPEMPIYRLAQADIALVHVEVEALAIDLDMLVKLLRQLRDDDPRRDQVLRGIERAMDALDLHDVARTAAGARAELAPLLAVPARASAHRMIAVGHAHMDSAWLWPKRETVRKCSRTFANALELMDLDPDFRFVCSQAAQYDWIERLYPNVFAGIRERVRTGQWIPVGGMWVEADMNVPSGESIARQFVHGQRYFESRFGVRCHEVWIPDVFGYPATLPQIFAAGGCERFVTQKLSWNKQNKMPHHTFRWYGLDGTSVLTHFPPVDTYGAEIEPRELAHAQRNFADSGWSGVSLLPFGYGDGGGGPTREMLERMRRVADLDGLPRVELGTPNSFFDAVDADVAAAGDRVPEWHGELYFEMHRGTFTTQANTKLGNRTCERLLREAELWWSMAATTVLAEPQSSGVDYPYDTLDAAWKEVLFQQFHDIIPGSSIAWVYEDTAETYARAVPLLEALVDDALERLADHLGTGPVIANAATHARDEVMIGGADVLGAVDPSRTQLLGDGRMACRVKVDGLAVCPPASFAVDEPVVIDDAARTMSNGIVSVGWDGTGALASIVDERAARELLIDGRRGAAIEIAPDHPVEYDAWDLESWVRRNSIEVRECESIEVVERGPLVASVRVTRGFGRSTLTQEYVLRAGSARLDVVFDIDWHEDEQVLSVAFPLAVHSGTVECGIQFGVVSRPRYPNTSWDAAKFEVCAHRFVDVSEPSFGAAILNDSRYGHAVLGDAVRVTLLRAPKWPAPEADRGRHRTTVSVFPHG